VTCPFRVMVYDEIVASRSDALVSASRGDARRRPQTPGS
jgi:hypothetical protein